MKGKDNGDPQLMIEKLRESEELFHSICENSMIGLYRTTSNGQILFANPTLVKMLRYSSYEELATRNLEKDGFEPAYNRNLFLEQIEKDGEVIGLESEWIRKDGTVVYIRESARAIRDHNGNTLYYDGTVEDITDHKQMETALTESEDRYRDLVENSSDLICTHDLDGNLLSLNNAALKITGYPKEEALKMNMRNIIVPEYRRIFDSYLAKIKAIGHANGLMIIQTKTGEKRIWEYNSSTRKDGIANPIVRGMVKDVTELKIKEATLKRLNAELIKSSAEKDKLFSIIAHDLRSPFHAFLNLTKMIADESKSFSAEELSKIGNNMNHSANNLFTLLQNLFEWANMQKGSMNILPEELLLSDLISANVELLYHRSSQKKIQIINEVTNPVNVYADKNMINSVLLNLLSNAVKFTNRNGTVVINAKNKGNEMFEISVKDSGVGINKSIIDKLFKVGGKTGTKGTEGELSTGLGLLLCKEFVEKNGGKIWAESEEGVGSTFYFTLPERNGDFTATKELTS